MYLSFCAESDVKNILAEDWDDKPDALYYNYIEFVYLFRDMDSMYFFNGDFV